MSNPSITTSIDSLQRTLDTLLMVSPHDLSPQAQKNHADNLHRVTQGIYSIEKLNTSAANHALQTHGQKLASAANKLEQLSERDNNLSSMVDSIKNGLGALDEIIEIIK